MQVFLDLDGVLADFDKAAFEIFGVPFSTQENRVGAFNAWETLTKTPNFFGNLDLMPGALELLDVVNEMSNKHGTKPIVLTGCPRGGWGEPQKVGWCHAHLGKEVPVITCNSRRKHLEAMSFLNIHSLEGCLLIDDRPKVKKDWIKLGGEVIHHRETYSTIAELYKVMEL